MPIELVAYEKCTSCGMCERHCPGDVIRLDEDGRPYNAYPEDCWYCGSCEYECPTEAIEMVFPFGLV